MAYIPPNKFHFGVIKDVIALVDSRHDFKGFSQDIVSKPRNTDVNDYIQHFHNNLQRISLGFNEEYSRRLTSRCNLGPNDVMGIGPENEFLNYIVETVCNANPQHWNVIPYRNELTDNTSYNTYHSTIAALIRNGNQIPVSVPPNNPIPLVVDTHRTLSHNSSPHFIICRNKECVADPSKTSAQTFDNNIAEESDEIQRTYTINGITHTLNGTINAPNVTYGFPSGYSETLQFKKVGGHKPNEINVCKTRIQAIIKSIITPLSAGGTVVATVNDGNDLCTDYDNIIYTPLLTQPQQNSIGFAYIAKRAGDQLQVLSCLESILYKLLSTGANYTIKNCIFWTIDAIAACFAILNNITTVLQHPDKSVTIYRRADYTPNIEPIAQVVEGGKHKKYKKKYYGGATCTQDSFNALLNGSEHQNKEECWYRVMQALCDIRDPNDLYEPWTLLNFLVYYLCVYYPNIYNYLISIINHPNFQLSNDNCFGLYPQTTDLQQSPIVNESGIETITKNNRIIVYIDAPSNKSFIIQRFPDGLKFYINFQEINGYIPIPNLIPITEQQINIYYEATMYSNINIIGGGKNHTFYDNWNELKMKFNINKANKLFLDFIQLLSLCETKYFQNIDSADNFYIYDPKSHVYIGGHTQIEFLSFFNSIIETYNIIRDKTQFLKMFIQFPTLLNKTKYNTINRDIYDYISYWFNYEQHIDRNITINGTTNAITTIFDKIIEETEKTCRKVNRNLSSDNHKAAQYLNTIFPHGYFTIKFNELTKKISNNIKLDTKTNSGTKRNINNKRNRFNIIIKGGKYTKKRKY